MSVPGPTQGSGGSSHCCFLAQKDSAGAWTSLFWPCLFWFLLMQGQNCFPESGKSEQRGAAAWPEHLAGDIVRRAETPFLPSKLNSSCPIRDTICLPSWKPWEHQQICWQQNLMATFFSQCQIQCWCHVPRTHLSARAGSCWKHWSLLAFTGFSRFTQQLTQTSLTPQWKQIFNKQLFFAVQKLF